MALEVLPEDLATKPRSRGVDLRSRGTSTPTPTSRLAGEPARAKERIVDALTLLKKDHDEVKKMLKDLDATSDRAIKTGRTCCAPQVLLTVHEQMEEAVLYPALKEHAETKEIVLEAYEEHDVVDTILGSSSRPRSTTRRGTQS
jgi:hypothetical protein